MPPQTRPPKLDPNETMSTPSLLSPWFLSLFFAGSFPSLLQCLEEDGSGLEWTGGELVNE